MKYFEQKYALELKSIDGLGPHYGPGEVGGVDSASRDDVGPHGVVEDA